MTRRPWTFFALFLALSVPVWILGAVSPTFLPEAIPINLPTAALMTFNPALAAAILTVRDDGARGLRALIARALDARRMTRAIWWLPIFGLMPLVMIVNWLWVVGAGRAPEVVWPPWSLVPVLFGMFLIVDLGEELGWQGYAYDPLARRFGALATALGMGAFWALIHVVPLLEAGRAPDWIFWHCLGQVALRVLTVWIYVNTGRSVFATTVFHTMTNMSEYLIPNYGSSYDPLISTSVLWLLALGVMSVWRPSTLAQLRRERRTV